MRRLLSRYTSTVGISAAGDSAIRLSTVLGGPGVVAQIDKSLFLPQAKTPQRKGYHE